MFETSLMRGWAVIVAILAVSVLSWAAIIALVVVVGNV